MVIYFPDQGGVLSDGPTGSLHCRGLALQDGAAAWPAHRDNLEIYRKIGIDEIQYPISINVQTLPSMVFIEEITETEEKTTNACADNASWSGGNGLVDVRTQPLANREAARKYGFVDDGEICPKC